MQGSIKRIRCTSSAASLHRAPSGPRVLSVINPSFVSGFRWSRIAYRGVWDVATQILRRPYVL